MAASSILESVQNWFPVLAKPKEVLTQEKPRASFVGGLKNYLIATGIGVVLNLILWFVLGLLIHRPEGSMLFGGLSSVLLLIAVPLGSIFISGAIFAVAKLAGGKGNFSTQYYLSSLYAVPIIVLVVVASILLPPILVLLVAFLYGLYYLTLSLMETHEFGMAKAVVSWFVPGLLVLVMVLVVTFLLAVIFYAGKHAASA